MRIEWESFFGFVQSVIESSQKMIHVCRRVAEMDSALRVLWLRYRQHRLEDLRVTFQLTTMDLERKGPSGKDDISVSEPEFPTYAEWKIKGGVTLLLELIWMEG